ncbi:MAG: glycerophosphodiester phosphodiesterase [Frankiales bacterium]|nr:MAG: glycerophosphodiester phosphodiesterase [Frankiales bacterium]
MTLLAVAHRAGNDLAALRTAVELGVDVLEADVKVRGPYLEVRHSKHLRPLPWMWDSGPDGLEWTHTRVPQLQLDALLEALEVGHPTLMLDLKGPGRVGAKVADVIHAREPQVPFLVCSRWWPGLDAFADRPWARPLLTARNRAELALLRRRVRGTHQPYGVSLHPSLLTPQVVAELRDAVELVMTWGVNDLGLLRRVVDLGVNGVISDSPEVLQAVLARR